MKTKPDKRDETIRRLYLYLKEISVYSSPERLRRTSEKEYELTYTEALEYAYENVLSTAKQAIKGVRLPKVEK